MNQIYQIFSPGGLEAHAPGAWEQRGHDGHRSDRVLPQCRVRSLSLKSLKLIVREALSYIFIGVGDGHR